MKREGESETRILGLGGGGVRGILVLEYGVDAHGGFVGAGLSAIFSQNSVSCCVS